MITVNGHAAPGNLTLEHLEHYGPPYCVCCQDSHPNGTLIEVDGHPFTISRQIPISEATDIAKARGRKLAPNHRYYYELTTD